MWSSKAQENYTILFVCLFVFNPLQSLFYCCLFCVPLGPSIGYRLLIHIHSQPIPPIVFLRLILQRGHRQLCCHLYHQRNVSLDCKVRWYGDNLEATAQSVSSVITKCHTFEIFGHCRHPHTSHSPLTPKHKHNSTFIDTSEEPKVITSADWLFLRHTAFSVKCWAKINRCRHFLPLQDPH